LPVCRSPRGDHRPCRRSFSRFETTEPEFAHIPVSTLLRESGKDRGYGNNADKLRFRVAKPQHLRRTRVGKENAWAPLASQPSNQVASRTRPEPNKGIGDQQYPAECPGTRHCGGNRTRPTVSTARSAATCVRAAESSAVAKYLTQSTARSAGFARTRSGHIQPPREQPPREALWRGAHSPRFRTSVRSLLYCALSPQHITFRPSD
jgi:hypothetical protein